MHKECNNFKDIINKIIELIFSLVLSKRKYNSVVMGILKLNIFQKKVDIISEIGFLLRIPPNKIQKSR